MLIEFEGLMRRLVLTGSERSCLGERQISYMMHPDLGLQSDAESTVFTAGFLDYKNSS